MSHIDVDATRKAILHALNVYTEEQNCTMFPHMTANAVKLFHGHLFKDDGVDASARLDCFNQAVASVIIRMKNENYDFELDEDRLKEKFVDEADSEDIHLHSFVVHVLDQCHALEYGFGLIEKPNFEMHTKYTYTPEVKTTKQKDIVNYRMTR